LTVHLDRHAVDAILLDIEGTTTPISFVYDVLFPFARRHLRAHLERHKGTSDLAGAVAGLRRDWTDDVKAGSSPPPWRDDDDEALAGYVEWQMDRDRKTTGLKLLQGQIWEYGYKSGELRSELFPDVAPAIGRWRGTGLRVAIYSSGSELAQRLLFAHTADGDLTSAIDAFFDTRVGAKTTAASYQRIAVALGCSIRRLLFVSDVAGELDAAVEAGCLAALCVRPGNPPQVSSTPLDIIYRFDQILVQDSRR
jgi:enolase-phosphatase E1